MTTERNDDAPIVAVRGIVNRFGDQLIHDGVDLEVRRGEVLGIVGGSVSGKSVLLRTMLGLQRPTAGQVLMEGADITSMSERELLKVKHRYGVTYQQGALFSAMTVNLRLRELMLPTLIYPMLIPALMGAIRLSTLILAGDPIGADDQIWFRLLVAFDIIFTILTLALVEIVLVG